MGSLWAARRMASRATGSLTPASSNMTLPGLTTATQDSGEPLPPPMRVSAAFLVTGLCGNTLIHTLPPRFMWRVIAIRAASIWRLFTQPHSSAFRPNWPKSTLVPPFAVPAMRPRCCFLCLTLFGRSIVYVLSTVSYSARWSARPAWSRPEPWPCRREPAPPCAREPCGPAARWGRWVPGDLADGHRRRDDRHRRRDGHRDRRDGHRDRRDGHRRHGADRGRGRRGAVRRAPGAPWPRPSDSPRAGLSLIHISEPTRLGMISYAVFCLK